MNRGEKFNYFWLASANVIWKLKQPIIENHIEDQLFVLDGAEEDGTSYEWYVEKSIISPNLSWYQYYELNAYEYKVFYISKSSLQFEKEYEMCVANDGFTLAPPDYLYKDFDPSWEGDQHWLLPLQDTFWRQLQHFNPETYLGHGYYDLIVSKNKKFMADVEKVCFITD